MEIICCINNIPVTSRQCKLFDMYKKFIHKKSIKDEFSEYQKYVKNYDIYFEDVIDEAKELYEKIMGNNIK